MANDYVYMDHAATSWPTLFHPTIDEYGKNPSSLHSLGQQSKQELQSHRTSIEQSLNTPSGATVLFTSGGTEANNLILQGGQWDCIVSTETEHAAVYHTMRHMAARGNGQSQVFLPVDATGQVAVGDLANALDRLGPQSRVLVTLMYINNECGTMHNLPLLAATVHKYDHAYLHTDAVQAPGHASMDVQALGVDFLSLSAHKFHAPVGIGLLYCRDITQIRQPLLYGGGQQQDLRPGTEPVALIGAMARALAHAVAQDVNRLYAMRAQLMNVLLPYIVTGYVLPTGHPVTRSPHIVSFCVYRVTQGRLNKILEMDGVLCSGGSACSGTSPLPSHVLHAMGVPDDYIHGSTRLSVSHTNTDSEIAHVAVALEKALQTLLIVPDANGRV